MLISSPKVLVAFECSGVVRRAFALQGFDAWSCDLQPARDRSVKHLQCDVRDVLGLGWSLMVAHPPCTFLTYARARWWKDGTQENAQKQALELFNTVLGAPIPHIAVENPRGIAMREIRWPDDVVEPYEFGDPYKKRTYLWLKNLPPLMRTLVLDTYEHNWTVTRGGDRAYERSVTSEGIARAMAAQWGGFVDERS